MVTIGMTKVLAVKSGLLALSLLVLSACGGDSDEPAGGGSPGGAPSNSAPTANAGPDQNVGENSTVDLDGTGSSDPDGDALTYAWVQTEGPSVSLSDANSAQSSFTAPGVTAGNTLILGFQLTVDDGITSATDSVEVTVSEGLPVVTVAGKLQYEFVPPNANCRGLNFNRIQQRPIRGATVQLLDGHNETNVLDTARTDANGDYAFSNVAADTDVRIRVRAELKKTGSPGWDVEVRDNVLKNPDDPNAPRLSNRALYVVQWDSFNTGGSNIADADFVARTGWDGSSYTGTRAAAPLAILDQIYSGIQAIVAERPNEVFLPLDAFWSVNNTLTSELNIDTGELTASFYRPDIDSLFLLGDAGVDTEEFDDHVVMHEWGHYFEDAFSRSDSIGGPHSIGQSLDARLAFGEGFATAMAAMVLEEQQYCDTSAAGSNSGFGISTESENRGLQGWMNEMSVATLIYDLWDTDDDGADNGSIGWRIPRRSRRCSRLPPVCSQCWRNRSWHYSTHCSIRRISNGTISISGAAARTRSQPHQTRRAMYRRYILICRPMARSTSARTVTMISVATVTSLLSTDFCGSSQRIKVPTT
jgi:hypothetical protein